ncbi:MAG: hypothetical protein N2314_00135 [Brevinematales bacterium]|nr:hypothetical protein [Brevinematales bacterium]
MSFKYVFFLWLCFCGVALWGEEKQRVGIAGFLDISPQTDEIVGTILQNSLASVLQKDSRFSVVFVSNAVTNLSHAREKGMESTLDVIIYGTYRREGREFVVLVQIYDILENELRMSRLYRGEYSRNIFDTVDAIAASASEEIKRVLPVLVTEEDIAKAQAKRKEIYKSQEVSLRREMRIGLGVMNTKRDFMYEQRRIAQQWQGISRVSVPFLSLSIRFEMFRFTLEKISLLWLPMWYETQGNGTWYQSDGKNLPSLKSGIMFHDEIRGRFFLYGDVFWGRVGGIQPFFSIGGFGADGKPLPDMEENLSVWGVVGGGGVFAKNWEIACLVQVWPLSQGWRSILKGFDPDFKEYATKSTNIYQWNTPFVGVKGSYFLTPNFGITLRTSFMEVQRVHRWYDTWGLGEHLLKMATTDISLEVVYRFQFGF